MFAFCFVFGVAVVTYAQDTTQRQQQYQMEQEQEQGERIAISQLPDAVQQALEGRDYSGWTASNAYRKTKEDGETVYTVELMRGDETKHVQFDAMGNKLKEKEKKSKNK